MTRFLTSFAAGATLLAAALLAATTGCTTKSDPAKNKAAAPAANKTTETGKGTEEVKKKDDHAEKGPHGGPLAEWGEEKYHAEFTVDHGKKMATVYLLDGEAKKASPIAAESITVSLSNFKPPVQVTLKADPQTGDPKGQASRFSGTHDALAKEMEFEGEICGKVGDTPYAGSFKEKGEHEHKKK